jgi:hypothetical protein
VGGRRHASGDGKGPGVAVGRQRPGRGAHRWRRIGERRGLTSGPPLQSQAVPGQNGLNRFKISNGLKIFNFFKI